jgi:FemAB-related protein (PEP-CTERM system-associated)
MKIDVLENGSFRHFDEACNDLLARRAAVPPSLRPEWVSVLRDALRHEPFCVTARRDREVCGVLPLVLVRSRLFGRFLVSLPYLNTGGVLVEDSACVAPLIARAVQLAETLNVRYLELRHEERRCQESLNYESTEKVHMRLALPASSETLWSGFKPKLRSQIRNAEKKDLTVHWGTDDLLPEFYSIFATNMRDLGTPVYSRRLFAAILNRFGRDAEICVIRQRDKAVAAGLLVHGRGISDVPSASSLRHFNHLNGNMLLYWHLLVRSIERGQQLFDFGRSSEDSSTYRFKKQWGACPYPAVWQYQLRNGSIADMRPDSPRNRRRVEIWQRLPVWLTRIAGPHIVRGIP